MEDIIATYELPIPPALRLDLDSSASIFYQVVHSTPDIQEAFERLVLLTHVCRKWRTLALGLAELWGEVAFVRPKSSDMFNTLLARAENALLSMPFNAESPLQDSWASEEQITFSLAHPERFRALGFRGRVKADWATVLSGRKLPHLERAFLYTSIPSLNHMHAPLQVPALRSVIYYDFFLRLEAPNLTALVIAASPSTTLSFDFPYLREVLMSVPNLTSLSLLGCLPIASRDSDRHPIDHHCLNHLTLGGSCSSISLVLRQLRLHDINAVFFALAIPTANDADIAELATALNPYFGGTSRNTICVEPDGRRCFTTCTHSSYDAERQGLGRISLWLHGSLIDEERLQQTTSLYRNLLLQFSLDQIDHLEVVHSVRRQPGPSQLHISVASALTVPQIANSVRTVLYHIHTSNLPDSSDDLLCVNAVPRFLWDNGSATTAFNKLETLVLDTSGQGYESMTTEAMSEPDGLREWLMGRMKMGRPLRTLVLQGDVYASEPMSSLAHTAKDAAYWRSIEDVVAVVDKRKLRVCQLKT